MKKSLDKTTLLIRSAFLFSQACGITLRPYQEEALQGVLNSIFFQHGQSFVWIFPRQSGKDETLAILVAYLLAKFSRFGGEMVFFNPTFSPQTETSMRRLETRLQANPLTQPEWKKRSGYIFQDHRAFCTYLSAEPTAHVVSATANRLLVVNEAQDVSLQKYDKDIAPMAASANATRLFAGTRWTADTLLEREYRLALETEKADGLRHAFLFTADDVGRVLPAYRRHVRDVITRLGRLHPLVKSQYFCERVEAEQGLFPPGRQALMHGVHAPRTAPEPGKIYAFLIDVAGYAGGASRAGVRGAPLWGMPASADPAVWTAGTGISRDSTFLKIVEVDLASVETIGLPTYRVVHRQEWTGASHVKVFGALKALKECWRPLCLVIDATGVGEGLWSLLDQAYGETAVIPVKFTAPLKSELGYGFLGLVESGRYLEYHPFPAKFQLQLDHCRAEVLPGPGKLMRWGVPDGARGSNGEYIHDDDLVTGALCCLLDRFQWRLPLNPASILIPSPLDPLKELEKEF